MYIYYIIIIYIYIIYIYIIIIYICICNVHVSAYRSIYIYSLYIHIDDHPACLIMIKYYPYMPDHAGIDCDYM